MSNSALPQLYERCPADLVSAPVNPVRLTLHRAAMAPRIVNCAAWRAHVLSVLRQQIDARGDGVLQGLFAEVSAYPATPLRIEIRLGIRSFLGTVTVFGAPNDATFSELALEMPFPADDRTAEIAKAMVEVQERSHDGANP